MVRRQDDDHGLVEERGIHARGLAKAERLKAASRRSAFGRRVEGAVLFQRQGRRRNAAGGREWRGSSER
jgi:hypothetical protein